MSNIVSIIRSAIETGSYDLSSVLETIAYHQAHGDMTLEEMEELTSKARAKAKPQYKEEDISQLFDRLHALEERVEKLEDTEVVEKCPEYEDDRWYFSGEGVTFENTKYTCIAKKTKFSPAEKPKDWQEVVE